MNKINTLYLLSGVLLSSLVLILSACRNDSSSPSIAETNQKLLSSGTWKISSVKTDGVDHTSSFTGLTLRFTANTYTTVNGHDIWPASGNWAFIDDTATSIQRSDDVIVNISSISASSLVLSLNWEENLLSTGRNNSIQEAYVFTFSK